MPLPLDGKHVIAAPDLGGDRDVELTLGFSGFQSVTEKVKKSCMQ